MMDCWKEDPNTRPSFDHLHDITTAFLQDEVRISILLIWKGPRGEGLPYETDEISRRKF